MSRLNKEERVRLEELVKNTKGMSLSGSEKIRVTVMLNLRTAELLIQESVEVGLSASACASRIVSDILEDRRGAESRWFHVLIEVRDHGSKERVSRIVESERLPSNDDMMGVFFDGCIKKGDTYFDLSGYPAYILHGISEIDYSEKNRLIELGVCDDVFVVGVGHE